MKKQNNQKSRVKTPSKEWFNNYRSFTIDYELVEKLYESSFNSQISEVRDYLDDSEYLHQNFPSYTLTEMEDFIEYDYRIESTFIKNLKVFILNERKRLNQIQREFSEDEKNWLEYHFK